MQAIAQKIGDVEQEAEEHKYVLFLSIAGPVSNHGNDAVRPGLRPSRLPGLFSHTGGAGKLSFTAIDISLREAILTPPRARDASELSSMTVPVCPLQRQRAARLQP